MKSLVSKRDKRHLKKKEFPPKSVLYLFVMKSHFFILCKMRYLSGYTVVFSLFFQTTTNASLPSLQNPINPLSQSQRIIPHTANSTGIGGALNRVGEL